MKNQYKKAIWFTKQKRTKMGDQELCEKVPASFII